MKSINDYIAICNKYMFLGGVKKNYADEKEVEEDICLYISGIVEMLPHIKNQVDCDCPKEINKQNYTIDLVIKAEDGYLPIELKHSISATKEEIEEDFEKLQFYTNCYQDMPIGMFIYYTQITPLDPLACKLDPVQNVLGKTNFYYKLITRDNNQYNADEAISFDGRWDAKK